LVGKPAAIGRYALGFEVGIAGIRADDGLLLGDGFEFLVAVAQLDGGSALSGLRQTREVSTAADCDR
jgi:hypothetical protein